MAKIAEYIQRIEIDSLWAGRMRVDWTLHRHVNVLSGVNGAGKSTIINRVAEHLAALAVGEQPDDGVRLTLSDPQATRARFDVVRPFDRREVNAELTAKVAEMSRRTDLDPAPLRAVIDDLMSDTRKRLAMDEGGLAFEHMGQTIPPALLSSGEKQMLVILLTAWMECCQPCVLLMDEPEISLHVEWQERLITLVRQLNPNAQIILTTHSPAVIMDGWADCVTDAQDIIA